jgi:putative spermidine/putrescine transport system ATP-binding protein
MSISVQGLVKSYGTLRIVHGISFEVGDGEFVSLLGPSGCGKTTTLRCIAGLEDANGGVIGIDGQIVSAPDQDILVPVHERQVGMVFQSYAIWPHMTVAENVGFPLSVRKLPQADIARQVDEALAIVGLGALKDRHPSQLSGGQQQRVALARAIVGQPKVLLFDEPLSNLDAKLREGTRAEIRRLQRELNVAAVYVTHDQEEALSMSDRIVVMNEGRVEQIGTPFEIYNHPRTRFVASFVGTLNILKGKVVDPAAGKIVVDGQELFASKRITHLQAGEACSVALRPEAASLHQSELQEAAKIASAFAREGGPRNRLVGTIEEVSFLGSVVRIRVRFQENAISLDTFNNPNVAPPARGTQVTVTFAREDLLVLEGAEG